MYPCLKYTTKGLLSTIKSINAEVAKNVFLFRLNEAYASPLIAPPVPNHPAKKPESPPPKNELRTVDLNVKLGLIIRNKENKIMKIPSKTDAEFEFINCDK